MSYLIDLVIVFVFVFYLIDGYRSGFIKNFLDLLGFIIALLVAFLFNNKISNLLSAKLPLPLSLTKISAFLAVWLLVDISYSLGIFFIYRLVPKEIKETKINKILGVVPAFFKATVVILLALLFLTSIPIEESFKLKKETEKTHLAKIFLGSGSWLQKPYQDVFSFFTLPPESKGTVALNYQVHELRVDQNSEKEMLRLVNQEREMNNLSELKMDEGLKNLARDHADDMFSRDYFSHYTPEGLSPFDRMKNVGIVYLYAGENLALAPDVLKAEQGLMDSPGHRENILSPNFNKIGIGVIDAGIYGKMFVQEFTN